MVKSALDDVTRALSVQRSDMAAQALERYEADQDPDILVSAFQDLDDKVVEWQRIGEHAANGMAWSIFQIHKLWDRLPTDFTSTWGYDFWKYALERTGASSASTVRNMLNVANVYLSGEMELKGKPAGFNPYRVKYSNLLLMAHKARAGELDETEWELLADPSTSFDTLEQNMHPVKKLTEVGKRPYWKTDNGLLYYSENGYTVAVASVETQASGQELQAILDHAIEVLYRELGI